MYAPEEYRKRLDVRAGNKGIQRAKTSVLFRLGSPGMGGLPEPPVPFFLPPGRRLRPSLDRLWAGRLPWFCCLGSGDLGVGYSDTTLADVLNVLASRDFGLRVSPLVGVSASSVN